jgi:hypothetical protein
VVREDGRIEIRPVQLGVLTRKSAQVLAGLNEGERVVAAAGDKLF